MATLIVCGLIAVVGWTGFARRLQQWHISGPLMMVCLGAVAGLVIGDSVGSELNTQVAERVVEIILAILLFLDATEVRGGFLAGERSTVVRLLVIAFPLSILLAVVIGIPLLGVSSWAVALVIACIVAPIDFAPATSLLRERSVRRGVRHALAVESGYNDGIASPVFVFALLMAGVHAGRTSPAEALEQALPAAGFALLIGVVVGAGTGFLMRVARERDWTHPQGARIAMVLVPLLTYGLSLPVGGNGFIAAFIAGIAYKLGHMGRPGAHHDIPHSELAVVEDVGSLVSLLMWFVFGAVSVLVFGTLIDWGWILFGVLALTALRMIPVWLAMLGSRLDWRERTILGLYGPRGTSSIVLGLLAYNALREDEADIALYVTTVVVIGSLVLHGLIVPLSTSADRRRASRADP